MENAQLPLTFLGLLYLLFHSARLPRTFTRQRTGVTMRPAHRRVTEARSFFRLGLRLTAGFALVRLLRDDPIWGTVLIGGSIALAAGVGLRLRAERRSVASESLVLLQRLSRGTEAGADFFTALGAARGDLPDGRVRRAVDETLNGYAQREPLADCLRPLAPADRTLAGLAADVRRTGWEASPGLAEAVGLVREAAVRRWDRGRGARVRLDRLETRLPGLRVFAAGTAAGGLAVMATLFPAAYAGEPVAGPAAAAAAEPAGSPIGIKPLPEPLPAAIPAFHPIDDPLPFPGDRTAAAVCRIVTGVPDGLVNVRERPGMAGRVAFHAADGDLLEWIAETGDPATGAWRRVRTGDGRVGWVFAPLCVMGDE
jgi:hypothetical protein